MESKNIKNDENKKRKQLLSQNQQSVIPEASERDELTVNENDNMGLEFPMDPQTAQKRKIADKFLTDFEKTEIEEYEQIYFLCANETKIKPTKLERLVNNGFDDEEGYYKI